MHFYHIFVVASRVFATKAKHVPIELLEAEPAGVAVVDLVDGILENLPRFLRVLLDDNDGGVWMEGRRRG